MNTITAQPTLPPPYDWPVGYTFYAIEQSKNTGEVISVHRFAYSASRWRWLNFRTYDSRIPWAEQRERRETDPNHRFKVYESHWAVRRAKRGKSMQFVSHKHWQDP